MESLRRLCHCLFCAIDSDAGGPAQIPQSVGHDEVLEFDIGECAGVGVDRCQVSDTSCVVSPYTVASDGPQDGGPAVVVRQSRRATISCLGQTQGDRRGGEEPAPVELVALRMPYLQVREAHHKHASRIPHPAILC